MVTNKKAKGVRAKTRSKFSRKGTRLSVNDVLQEFDEGSTVQINAAPSFHEGFPFRRYQGISGKIAGKQGKCYKVSLFEGNAPRTIIVHAAHLKLLSVGKNN